MIDPFDWREAETRLSDQRAQGFIGDGSQVTNVDSNTLDGNDSSDFAGASEAANVIAACARLHCDF